MNSELARLLPELNEAQIRMVERLMEDEYRRGYNENSRVCFCYDPGRLIPHRHLMDDGESYDIKPQWQESK